MPTKAPTLAQVIDEYMQVHGGYAPTDEVARYCLSAGVFSDDYRNAAAFKQAQSDVRRVIKTILDPTTGLPKYFNVLIPNGGEEPIPVYMQEELFTVEHYKQVIEYYTGKGRYYLGIAERLAQQCRQRYGYQPALPGISPN